MTFFRCLFLFLLGENYAVSKIILHAFKVVDGLGSQGGPVLSQPLRLTLAIIGDHSVQWRPVSYKARKVCTA